MSSIMSPQSKGQLWQLKLLIVSREKLIIRKKVQKDIDDGKGAQTDIAVTKIATYSML